MEAQREQKAKLTGIQEHKEFNAIRHMKQHNETMSYSQTITKRRFQYCGIPHMPIGYPAFWENLNDVGRATIPRRSAGTPTIVPQEKPKKRQTEEYMTYSKIARCQTENWM